MRMRAINFICAAWRLPDRFLAVRLPMDAASGFRARPAAKGLSGNK